VLFFAYVLPDRKTTSKRLFWSRTLYRQKLSVQFTPPKQMIFDLKLRFVLRFFALCAVMVMITINYRDRLTVIYNHDLHQNCHFSAIYMVKTLPFLCQFASGMTCAL
jgi:hypothetical protein